MIQVPSSHNHPTHQITSKCNVIALIQTQSYLNSVTAHCSGTFEAGTLLMCYHEELCQALLHQTGKALVLTLKRRVLHILNHCTQTTAKHSRKAECLVIHLLYSATISQTNAPEILSILNGHKHAKQKKKNIFFIRSFPSPGGRMQINIYTPSLTHTET